MSLPSAPAIPPPTAPRARPGFVDGFKAPFQGFAFIAKNPPVWPLALVPMAIALGLFILTGYLCVKLVPSMTETWFDGTTLPPTLVSIVTIVATALSLLLAALIAFGLAQPLSGPALERIVRRAEALEGAPSWPPTSALQDIARSLASLIVSYAFGLPILALLFLLNFVFPPAAVVTFPLKLATTALLLAWDFFDIPLSIRGRPVGQRVAFVKRNAVVMLGFGVGLSLLTLVPCAFLLILPAGVAGGARLCARIEQAEATA